MGWIVDRNPTAKGQYLCTVYEKDEYYICICNWNDKWTCVCDDINVIAWQALPETYKVTNKKHIENTIDKLERDLKNVKKIIRETDKKGLLDTINKIVINAHIDLSTCTNFSGVKLSKE